MTITAEPVGLDPHRLRELLRRQAATVTVVTAPGVAGGPPAGFTATSFTSVSLRPQLVSFCLDRDSTSWPAVEQARHVAVHLLAAGQQHLARTFATSGIDRFADPSAWTPGPYGMPLLHGVLATLVCEVQARVPAGDHAIVLGTPIHARHRDGEPLVYHNGGYRRLDPGTDA
ncbi:MAG: flavin reductase family protein [Hamadaea sp.]|uniref:flavin reductase family protein n=1 Tax=Hamadaea sp. TaxID=2024425 RepID=UPI0017D1D057|nr:flavin reductase family protein [Hamadaea sp.]NUR69917.1 flavin reductase family protein [Hamadaea sp.]NUT22521.1 flavin reductase family protein [Hamadaea sp.]